MLEIQEIIQYSPEVKTALQNNKPVVALESTLIAHGFPYPENYQLALELEEQARKAGVVPATIAILGGKIKVGLEQEELEYIARGKEIYKASLRDLPILLAKKKDGGTTVATTMQIADLAGIKVFVTGGIGGVHRNAEETMDISADLAAFSRYQVIVVSAGAKSVLDLPKTREVLESRGVPVLGYRSELFPAFYLRDSGLKVDYRIDSPAEIREIMKVKDQLGIFGGLLVTTPIPRGDELDEQEYNRILKKLLRETEEKGVTGKDVTPYLLRRLREETGGESVKANIALVKNNLNVGCEIAVKLVEDRN